MQLCAIVNFIMPAEKLIGMANVTRELLYLEQLLFGLFLIFIL